jgi:hypothetical protein
MQEQAQSKTAIIKGNSHPKKMRHTSNNHTSLLKEGRGRDIMPDQQISGFEGL